MWRVYGDWFTTAEGTNTSKAQKLTMNSNMILKAARFFVGFYNNPAFTQVKARCYADLNGSVGGLIADSAWVQKSAIITDTNGLIEFACLFDDVYLRNTESYHFVLYFDAYTGTDTSHVFFRKAWPDPVYNRTVPETYLSQIRSGYYMYLVGNTDL